MGAGRSLPRGAGPESEALPRRTIPPRDQRLRTPRRPIGRAGYLSVEPPPVHPTPMSPLFFKEPRSLRSRLDSPL